MSFTIRFATKNDMKAVHDLITELAVFENEPEAVEISIQDLERDGFSETPKFRVFIAEEGIEIIGMALFYERFSTWKGKAIHLEDLIVTQSRRKYGVGKALYTELMKYAFENGYKRVAWEVLDWNKNAIDFYESTGAHILEGWQVVHMTEENLKKIHRVVKIYKFGGASVKDAESIKNVASILRKEGTENCLLVISAMGKMTNAFENVLHAYCNNKSSLQASIGFIREYHQSILQELFNEDNSIYKEIEFLYRSLHEFLEKNTSTDYDELYDQIVCFGELLSTTIVSHYFSSVEIENIWNDVRHLIKTDSSFRDAKVDWKKTQETILANIDQKKLNIVQGFLGGDDKGNTTTLGREGSDYTAGIFAYCLDAESVTIWKDVQGVLNADPRVFEEPQLLEQISYEETIEMAFYGASVIHPKTIQPLQSKEIPLYVRSFKDTSLKGTKVTRGVTIEPYLPCFIVKKNQILISISARDFSFMVEDNISHIFKLLHQYLLKVNLIQNSAISFSVCVDNKFNQFDTFHEELKSSYKVEVVKDVDLYTIRHFDQKALDMIYQSGTPVLTQINKETAQIIIKED